MKKHRCFYLIRVSLGHFSPMNVVNKILPLFFFIGIASAQTDPTIHWVKINNQEVSLNGSITVTMTTSETFSFHIQVENEGDDSPAGYNNITASFSQFTGSTDKSRVSRGSGTSGDLDYAEYFGNEAGGGDGYTEWIMVEGVDNNGWDGSDGLLSETNKLELNIQPKQYGNFYIYYRVAMSNQESWVNGWIYLPSSSSYTDALGFYCYRIKVIVEAPKPDLTVTSPSAPSSAAAGEDINISCTVINQGDGSTGSSSYVGYYLSTSPYGTDTYLDEDYVGTLSSGGSSNESEAVTIPSSTPPGHYYINFFADHEYDVDEGDYENNNIAYDEIDILAPPDAPSFYSSGPSNVYPTRQYSVTVDYTDPDGRSDLDIVYLRLAQNNNEDTYRLTMMWELGLSPPHQWADEGQYLYDLQASKSNITDGYRVIWTFKVNWDWEECSDVDYWAFALDNGGLESQHTKQNSNADYENDLVISGSDENADPVTEGNPYIVTGDIYFQNSTVVPSDWSGISMRMDRDAVGGTNYAVDNSPGGGYEVTWNTQTGDAGSYTFYIYVLNSNHQPPNNSGTYYDIENMTVLSPSGSFTIYVKNQHGSYTSNKKVIRYDANWNPIDSKVTDSNGKVSWTGIPADSYRYEVYNNDGSGDFWGGGEATVNNGQITTIYFQRKAPYITQVQKPSRINIGQNIHVDVTVYNNEGAAKPTKLTIRIDKSQSSPYDFEETHGPINISAHANGYFGFDYTPTTDGRFYISAIVFTQYGNHTNTDTRGWDWHVDVKPTVDGDFVWYWNESVSSGTGSVLSNYGIGGVFLRVGHFKTDYPDSFVDFGFGPSQFSEFSGQDIHASYSFGSTYVKLFENDPQHYSQHVAQKINQTLRSSEIVGISLDMEGVDLTKYKILVDTVIARFGNNYMISISPQPWWSGNSFISLISDLDFFVPMLYDIGGDMKITDREKIKQKISEYESLSSPKPFIAGLPTYFYSRVFDGSDSYKGNIWMWDGTPINPELLSEQDGLSTQGPSMNYSGDPKIYNGDNVYDFKLLTDFPNAVYVDPQGNEHTGLFTSWHIKYVEITPAGVEMYVSDAQNEGQNYFKGISLFRYGTTSQEEFDVAFSGSLPTTHSVDPAIEVDTIRQTNGFKVRFILENNGDEQSFTYYWACGVHFRTVAMQFSDNYIDFGQFDTVHMYKIQGNSLVEVSQPSDAQFIELVEHHMDSSEADTSGWISLTFTQGKDTLKYRSWAASLDDPFEAGSYPYFCNTHQRLETKIYRDPVDPSVLNDEYDGTTDILFYKTYDLPLQKQTNVTETELIPSIFILFPNQPNPFVSETNIRFATPIWTHVTLEIYDAPGKCVRTILDEKRKPGYHTTKWDGKDAQGKRVASGIYFIKFKAGDYKSTKKLILMR